MANTQTKYRHATLEFGPDLWAALTQAAQAADLSRSQYVRKAVRELLDREAAATQKKKQR